MKNRKIYILVKDFTKDFNLESLTAMEKGEIHLELSKSEQEELDVFWPSIKALLVREKQALADGDEKSALAKNLENYLTKEEAEVAVKAVYDRRVKIASIR